ncbi:MAG: hypothetical protein QGD94_08400, partial [Planctomycetia bacterium]|nr:hypothetical protein [Planctomycetia bacterium]
MTLRNQYAAKALEKSRTVSAKNILVSIVVGLALALTGCLPRQPNVVMPVAPLVTKQGFDYNSVALTPRPPRPKKSSTDKNLHRLSEGLMPAYRHPEWVPTVKERRWAWIVVHHSATRRGSALIFGRFHRENRRWDELGYHFVIGNGFGS